MPRSRAARSSFYPHTPGPKRSMRTGSSPQPSTWPHKRFPCSTPEARLISTPMSSPSREVFLRSSQATIRPRVLDVAHTYNYFGRASGDLISAVVSLRAFTPGQSATPDFVLTSLVPEHASPPSLPQGFDRYSHEEDFVSPALSAFFGRPIHMRAWVILPTAYDEHATTTPATWPVQNSLGQISIGAWRRAKCRP